MAVTVDQLVNLDLNQAQSILDFFNSQVGTLQAQLDDSNTLVTALERDLAAQITENAALHQAIKITAQTFSQPSNHGPAKAKGRGVAEPDPFDGKRENGRRFLHQIWMYIQAYPETFTTDQDQILFMLSWMKSGSAAVWAETLGDDLRNGATLTMDQVKNDFELNFVLVDEAGDAQNRIDNMTQGARSVSDYVTEFRSYASKSGYGQAELIRKFKKGLHNNTLRDIMRLPGSFTTVADIYAAATQLEGKDQEFRALTSGRTQLPSTSFKSKPIPHSTPLPPLSKPHHPDAMDVDHGRTRGNKREPYCHRCKTKGHWTSDLLCPQQVHALRQILASTGHVIPVAPAAAQVFEKDDA
jgi:hypothetical protein